MMELLLITVYYNNETQTACAVYCNYCFNCVHNLMNNCCIVLVQLVGFGLSCLVGIDPNQDNFVGAGIFHSRNQQVGVLLRLEPNKQAQVCMHLKCIISAFLCFTFNRLFIILNKFSSIECCFFMKLLESCGYGKSYVHSYFTCLLLTF